MKSVERFKKRKKLINKIEKRNGLFVTSDEELLVKFESSDIDIDSINSFDRELSKYYDCNFYEPISDEETNELLTILEKEFDDRRFNDLIKSCKKDILSSIVGPFGLGFIVSKFDKDGGNVTTNHNFKQGVTATAEDAQRYSEWMQSKNNFNREPYDFDQKLNRFGEIVLNKNGEPVKVPFNSTKKKEIFKKKENGEAITDGYTGKKLGIKENDQIKKNASIDLEHITSVKEIESDSGNHLFAKGENKDERQKDRVNLARNDKNLTLTEGSLNNSKGKIDLIKWANEPNKKDPSKTNAEHYGLNRELIEKEYKKSKNFLKIERFKNQIKKQGPEILVTGTKESFKMGLQQAIGLVLFEFFNATFDELEDIYKNRFSNGFEDQRFIHILKKRLQRIGERLAQRWQDTCKAFSDGFISGFLSNLITVIINMFVKTGKRVVRIIREGFISLLKAIKMMCFPPENMTSMQAAHEASKLIASGLVIVGGIAVEQQIDIMIKATPMIEPFADLLTIILIGSLTGLTVTFIVYAIDKLDFFKVNENEKHKKIINRLENRLETLFAESEVLIDELSFST